MEQGLLPWYFDILTVYTQF